MGKVTTRQLQCAKLFCAMGYMPSGASSIVGNLSWESGGANLPTAFRKRNLDHGSNGMPQWRLARLDAYEAFVREQQPNASAAELWNHYGRMDYQVRYIDIELKRDYPKLHANLTKGGAVAALTADFCWSYERPSKAYAHLAERVAFANTIFDALNPKSGPVTILNAVDLDAKTHDQQAVGGAAIATVGLLGGAGTVVQHVAPDLSWVEWTAIGLAVAILVGGVATLVSAMVKAARVRSAKVGLDVNQPAKVLVDQPVPPKPLGDPTPSKVEPSAAEQEAAGIQAMIDHAVGSAPAPAPAPAPVAPVDKPTAGEPVAGDSEAERTAAAARASLLGR